jgi:hypothetical protein
MPPVGWVKRTAEEGYAHEWRREARDTLYRLPQYSGILSRNNGPASEAGLLFSKSNAGVKRLNAHRLVTV